MKTLVFTSLLVLSLCCVPSAMAIVTDHQVEISSTSTGLSVTEDLTIQNNEELMIDALDFWVQQGTSEFSIILVEGNIELSPIKEGNVYNVNLTQEGINISTGDSKIFRLTYMLESTVEYFEKTVKMDTSRALFAGFVTTEMPSTRFMNKYLMYRAALVARLGIRR